MTAPTPDTTDTLLAHVRDATVTELDNTRYLTLKQATDAVSRTIGIKRSQAYTRCRTTLKHLIQEGRAYVWSRAKPMYVMAGQAQQLRDELKTDLLRVIAQGHNTSGVLKRQRIGGMCLGIDLMQELIEEMIDDGQLNVITNAGRGRIRVYQVAQAYTEHTHTDEDLELAMLTMLGYRTDAKKTVMPREFAAKVGMPELQAAQIFSELAERRLVTEQSVGHMRLYALPDLPTLRATPTSVQPIATAPAAPHTAPAADDVTLSVTGPQQAATALLTHALRLTPKRDERATQQQASCAYGPTERTQYRAPQNENARHIHRRPHAAPRRAHPHHRTGPQPQPTLVSHQHRPQRQPLDQPQDDQPRHGQPATHRPAGERHHLHHRRPLGTHGRPPQARGAPQRRPVHPDVQQRAVHALRQPSWAAPGRSPPAGPGNSRRAHPAPQ